MELDIYTQQGHMDNQHFYTQKDHQEFQQDKFGKSFFQDGLSSGFLQVDTSLRSTSILLILHSENKEENTSPGLLLIGKHPS